MFGKTNLPLFIAGLVLVALAYAGCEEETDPTFKVTGTSGEQVEMAGKWTSGCVVDGTDSFEDTLRIGDAGITFTSERHIGVTNCSTDSDISLDIQATVTLDGSVTIAGWVDDNDAAVAAPTGLDTVTTANGTTITGVSASMTPNTAAGATGLNDNTECDLTTWQAGTAVDVLVCFFDSDGDGVADPFQESWVIDDSGKPLVWYTGDDTGLGADAGGYPTMIANFEPMTK